MDFRALPPQRRQGIGRSHAGPDTRFGKRRSDRFAIFSQCHDGSRLTVSSHEALQKFQRRGPVDRLSSYRAAMQEIGNADCQQTGRRLNNRAENSHQPFRRRERAMQRFRSKKTLQKFSSIHGQVHNHFNQERHLVSRQEFKQRRLAALTEWRALAA